MSMSQTIIREARSADVAALVAIFAGDELGGHGDTTAPEVFGDYLRAFERLATSRDQTLYVAERDGKVVGTFQTMIVTSLVARGSSSMIIEAVQTRGDMRGQGIGAQMMEFAIAEAKRRDLRLVQLASNASRTDAHRFYKRLGFKQSHLGFKMALK